MPSGCSLASLAGALEDWAMGRNTFIQQRCSFRNTLDKDALTVDHRGLNQSFWHHLLHLSRHHLNFHHCQPSTFLWSSGRVRHLRTGIQFLMAVISPPDGDKSSTLNERVWARPAGYPVHLPACQFTQHKPVTLLQVFMTKGSLVKWDHFLDWGKKENMQT